MFCLNVVFFLWLVLLLNGKTLTLANGYKMKTLANGYKSTEKKTVANVFICLLLQKKIEIAFTVLNSYFNCEFSYPV
jgi:hypothetical protein